MFKKMTALLGLALLCAAPAATAGTWDYEFEIGALGALTWDDTRYYGDNWMDADLWVKAELGYQFNDMFSLHFTPKIKASFANNNSWRKNGSFGFFLNAAYGQFDLNWGSVYVGRLSDEVNVFGLAGLGYDPTTTPIETMMRPYSPDYISDGVRLEFNAGNFRVTGQATLVSRYNNEGGFWDDNPFAHSADALIFGSGEYYRNYRGFDDQYLTQRYHLEGAYFWNGGAASLGLSYAHMHVWNDSDESYTFYTFDVIPALTQSFGDFTLHAEGRFGKYDSEDTQYGWGLYLDGQYNYGPGSVTLAGWLNSGNKYDSDTHQDYSGMSNGFAPLIVAYGSMNSYPEDTPFWQAWYASDYNTDEAWHWFKDYEYAGNIGTSNHWGIGVWGEHAFSEKISASYALAYLGLTHPDYNIPVTGHYDDVSGLWIADSYQAQSRSLGFEIDLAASFQLTQNLELAVAGGYFFAGKALDYVWYDNTTGGRDMDNPDPNDKAVANWERGYDQATLYVQLVYKF